MATLALPAEIEIPLEEFGALTPVSRAGGQGRVHRPGRIPDGLPPGPVVVKLYHRPPPPGAADVLAEMAGWGRGFDWSPPTRPPTRSAGLRAVTAWPLATVSANGSLVGIAMTDVSPRFSVPFLMPSGRAQHVLLALEHLLGGDSYLERRGLGLHLSTLVRAAVAERIAGALGFLHQQAIVVGDLAPSNLLVGFRGRPTVCFIDCDSMVFRGRHALASVETGDWDLPREFGEPRGTAAADAYKLGLVVLRLFARSHNTRKLAAGAEHVPEPLWPLLRRALGPDPADRPRAGEWERALAGLVAYGRPLNQRYPGPVEAARPAPPRARPRHVAAAAPLRSPTASPGPRRPVSPLVWAAVFLVVLVLMMRLLASLASAGQGVDQGQGFGPGTGSFGGGGTPSGQQYFYLVPGGGSR